MAFATDCDARDQDVPRSLAERGRAGPRDQAIGHRVFARPIGSTERRPCFRVEDPRSWVTLHAGKGRVGAVAEGRARNPAILDLNRRDRHPSIASPSRLERVAQVAGPRLLIKAALGRGDLLLDPTA